MKKLILTLMVLVSGVSEASYMDTLTKRKLENWSIEVHSVAWANGWHRWVVESKSPRNEHVIDVLEHYDAGYERKAPGGINAIGIDSTTLFGLNLAHPPKTRIRVEQRDIEEIERIYEQELTQDKADKTRMCLYDMGKCGINFWVAGYTRSPHVWALSIITCITTAEACVKAKRAVKKLEDFKNKNTSPAGGGGAGRGDPSIPTDPGNDWIGFPDIGGGGGGRGGAGGTVDIIDLEPIL